MLGLIVLCAGATSGNTHPELIGQEIENYLSQKGSEENLKFELRPIFLSPTSNVHESMTAAAFNMSGILNRDFDAALDVDYVKGVYWNDSPERGLCAWCSVTEANLGALAWYRRFLAAQKLATAPGSSRLFTHGDPVFERSHFGDLAVIHSMANHNGVPALLTKQKAMLWAEFVYKVATGIIPSNSKLRDVKLGGFDAFFNSIDKDLYDEPLSTLFKDGNVRANALGSLLHLIQDSYSAAHVERVDLDSTEGRFCRGGVVRFLAYPGQDVKKHSAADKWPVGLLLGPLQPSKRVCDPLGAAATVLQLFNANANWHKVAAFLDASVFELLDSDALSGPGKDFEP